MDERLRNFPMYLGGLARDGIDGFRTLDELTLVGASLYCLGTGGGAAPTGVSIDVKVDGAARMSAICALSGTPVIAGDSGVWKTPHFGGGQAHVVPAPAGSEISIDLNLTGGTLPQFTGRFILFALGGKKS